MSSTRNTDIIPASNLSVDLMEEPKRLRQDQASIKKEKQPKLSSDCRIPIFKFLPTSELVRFVSKMHPLLGEHWSHELKFVVEQRLPLGVRLDPESILIDSRKEPMNVKFVLCDCLSNKISNIKHPELFQFSPLCELAEQVCLPAKFHGTDSPLGALYGQQLLAPLVNLRFLDLLTGPFRKPPGCTELSLDFTSLSPRIQQTLSQVESIRLVRKPLYGFSLSTFLLRSLESLKKLEVGIDEFCAVMPVMVPFKRLLEFWTLPEADAEMLMRLESLCIYNEDFYGDIVPLAMRQILHFLGTKCVQLSELSLPLSGEISNYIPVFRAMPNLVKLALDVCSLESNGLIDYEGPSANVKELSIIPGVWYNVPDQKAILMSVLAKFPNVRSFSAKVGSLNMTLQLATDVLSGQLFSCLSSLECIPVGVAHSLRDLQPLLAHSNLPLRVLILPSESFACEAKDPDFLVSLYDIMKSNQVQFLLIKGTIHPQAVARLEEIVAEDRKMSKQAKVLAWTDKGLPEQREIVCRPPLGIPNFTDVRISGVKNAGSKNGEEFTIRICHQHTHVTSHIV